MSEAELININPDRLVPWQAVLFHDKKARKAQVIIKEVCDLTGLTRNQMIGPSRLKRIVWPRRVAMWRMRTELGMTMEMIGEVMNRDHTTVVTALQNVKRIHDELLQKQGQDECPAERMDAVKLLSAGGLS